MPNLKHITLVECKM